MTGVGKRSYGLYLWHFPIFVAIDTRWGLGPLVREAGRDRDHGVVVMLSYRYIERPFLERKDRPRPAAEPAPTVTAEPVPRIAAERLRSSGAESCRAGRAGPSRL